MDICRRYPGAEFWTNIFTPYPGAPIMQRAFELGIDVPKTLEGWVDFFPRYNVLPWLKGRKHSDVQKDAANICRVAFNRVPIGVKRKNSLQRLVHGMIEIPARWRLDHHLYGFPKSSCGLKDLANRLQSSRPNPKWTRTSLRPRW